MFPAALSSPQIGFQLLIKESNLLYDSLNPGSFIVTSELNGIVQLIKCYFIKSVLFLVFILECFFYRYPCALDVALENHVKKMSSDHEKTVLHQFISLTMSCGKYQVGLSGVLLL